MKRSLVWAFSVLTVGALLALLPAGVAAQAIWTGPDRVNSITVEWLRPDFDEGDLAFLSSGLFLSGRLAVADNVRLVADVSFAYIDTDESLTGGDQSDVAIGNPYLGVEFGAPNRPVWGEFGLRAPLTPSDNNALQAGLYADYDRCEAFMADVLSFVGLAHYQLRNTSGFSMHLRGGPMLLVNTDQATISDDTEMYAIYSLQGWYDAARLRFGAGFTGRLWLTEDVLDLNEMATHHLGLALVGKFRGVEPGLHFRVPVDKEMSDFMNYVVGFNVTVPFGQR